MMKFPRRKNLSYLEFSCSVLHFLSLALPRGPSPFLFTFGAKPSSFVELAALFVRLFKRKHCDARDYTTEFNAVERHETREQSQTFRSGALDITALRGER